MMHVRKKEGGVEKVLVGRGVFAAASISLPSLQSRAP